jgi:Protein of unknown function (DUF2510)
VRVLVRVGLLITMAVCACVVLICLFAAFSSAGDSFFATYGSLDVLMVLVCLASMVIPVLAAIGVAREKLERISILLAAIPFTFFGLFVMVEFWGEIEPASYVAGAFSTLAVACAFVLSFLTPRRETAAAVAEPAATPTWPPSTPAPAYQPAVPPAGWYPDPGGVYSQRYWDGQRWTAQTH